MIMKFPKMKQNKQKDRITYKILGQKKGTKHEKETNNKENRRSDF